MRVMCIDNSGFSLGGSYKASDYLNEGQVYTVVGETESGISYILDEVKHPKSPLGGGFRKFRFIPISDIDETEFERNYKTETINA